MQKKENLDNIRHSLAHLLAAAVLGIYPDAKPAIGPSTDSGFYYDFEFSSPISDDNLPSIKKKMDELLVTWRNFSASVVTEEQAKDKFKDNPYKMELVEEIAKRKEQITLYSSGKFTDLCRGGHVSDMAKIGPDSFKLSHLAGAYWRGDEGNKMLTRIYGLAFLSKNELDKYESGLNEAKSRDHKKLGRELDLFTFSDLVGAGLPLWTPKGTVLRDVLDDYVWQLRKKEGYERVTIPHITKKDLYLKSGHWEKFSDELFLVSSREKHQFALKPMNCPHHTQLFARKLWSYRQMPQRYASTTMVYRDEQSGELHGISRTRSITQDDAHVFCRESEVKEEVAKIWDILTKFYESVGFELEVRLSLHDPNDMEKYLGSEALWKKSEDKLREIISQRKISVEEASGEATLYGPKLDFLALDAIGRRWQVATIQLDMNLPERFDLVCVNEKGERERIIMIHSAIMGSLERFLSVIIEHFAGNFPLWLSPLQVKILPIGADHYEKAREIEEFLSGINLRVEIDDSEENLGKKVRNAKMEKIPYWIALGDKEIETGLLSVSSRDSGLAKKISLKDLADALLSEVEKKSLKSSL